MFDWVKIQSKEANWNNSDHAPLIMSLSKNINDSNIIRECVIKSLREHRNESTFDELVAERLERILHWRKILDERFSKRKKDWKFCVQCLARLFSARFSGKSQSFGAFEWTLERIINCVFDYQPMVFTFCFGGYKNHYSPSHPEVDWAELFHLNFVISYLWPIIHDYKYGIILEYESEEVSIQYNNVPQEETDKYTSSFNRLLEYYEKKMNEKNPGLCFSLRYTLARDYYNDVSELHKLINEKIPTYEDIFNRLSSDEKMKWLQRAESNFMWQGTIPYCKTELSESKQRDILQVARIANEAFLDADYCLRHSFFEYKYRIPLVGTWGRMPSAQPIDGWIHIKSTEASLVDFWIGTGCYLRSENLNGEKKYTETILSRSQMEHIGNKVIYIENEDKQLCEISNNFSTIRVFDEKIDD